MKLYSFFNSSASFRVRIALAIKGLEHQIVPVDIRAGAQHADDFVGVTSPAPLVPVLEHAGLRISQSLAIIDYLDGRFPEPRLIPAEPVARARELAFASLVACDIHPLNNLRVLRYLEHDLRLDAAARQSWYQHWIDEGMRAAERLLAGPEAHRFCFADRPTLADCFLVPQVANALRMKCRMDAYPRALAVYEHAMAQPAFRAAAPAAQPDFRAA